MDIDAELARLEVSLARLRAKADDAHKSLLHAPDEWRDAKTLLRVVSGKLYALSMLVEDLSTSYARKDGQGQKPSTTVGDLAHLEAGESFIAGLTENRVHTLEPLKSLDFSLSLATIARSPPALARCLSSTSSLLPAPSQPGTAIYPASLDHARQTARRYALLVTKPGPRADSYNTYCSTSTDLADQCPEYGEAAAAWPGYADQFWPEVREAILHLFQAVKSPEFHFWLLEYCHGQWPKKFGPDASTRASTLKLMSTLDDPSFHPLHVAAALGLSRLCEELISGGSDPCLASPIGTPLYCALVGPRVLCNHKKDPLDVVRSPCPSISQEATIHLIAVSAHLPDQKKSVSPDGPLSISTLTFHVALRLRSVFIYNCAGPASPSDTRFNTLIKSKEFAGLPWGKPTPETRQFMHHVLLDIFDIYVPYLDDIEASICLRRLWETLESWGAEITKGCAPSRTSSLATNESFSNTVRHAVLDAEWPVLQRLMRDPRWEPHMRISSADDKDRPTILHSLVSMDQEATIIKLLQTTTDVHQRDAQKRTPILLVESVGVLDLLCRHGADTRDTDADGRNIWHYAAANNDVPILKWLFANDQNMDHNLRVLMKGGRTPIAQAVIYPLTQLGDMTARLRDSQSIEGGPSRKDRKILQFTKAAYFLLERCNGEPAYLRSKTPPLVHAAAEYGSISLLRALDEAGADMTQLDQYNACALHKLYFSATSEVVDLLARRCDEAGTPIFKDLGGSPLASTIINGGLQALRQSYTMHPAFGSKLNVDMFSRLLHHCIDQWFPGSDARPTRLRILWADFMDTVAVQGSEYFWEKIEPGVGFVTESLSTAITCFGASGAIGAWQDENKVPAVLPVLRRLRQLGTLDWVCPEQIWLSWMQSAILTLWDESGAELIKDMSNNTWRRELRAFLLWDLKWNVCTDDFIQELFRKGVYWPRGEEGGENKSTEDLYLVCHAPAISSVKFRAYIEAVPWPEELDMLEFDSGFDGELSTDAGDGAATARPVRDWEKKKQMFEWKAVEMHGVHRPRQRKLERDQGIYL